LISKTNDPQLFFRIEPFDFLDDLIGSHDQKLCWAQRSINRGVGLTPDLMHRNRLMIQKLIIENHKPGEVSLLEAPT
jgi:hypothetical protein